MTLSRWNISSSDFSRLLYVSSIIVNNWLYIDGGEYHPRDPTPRKIILEHALSIDLSSSWTTSSMQINAFYKPSGRNFKYEALWFIPKPSRILAFGGEPYSFTADHTNTIWTLTVDGFGGGTWDQLYTSNDSIWQSSYWPCYGLVAAGSTTGYIFGGYYRNSGYFQNVLGVIEFDLERSPKIGTTTTSKYFSMLSGAAQFVPSFGKAGIVALLGGDISLSGGSRPLSEITIYDPSSKLWYSQTATGDIPTPRTDMCIAGAQSANSSTFEIFVYGGVDYSLDPKKNTDSQNVYILTLPAFRWIRVNASTAPRAGSSCQVVNSQMISIGGWDPTDIWATDPWPYGVGVFDLTSLCWGNSFNTSAPQYVRSDLVNDFYAKNPLHPVLWNDSALGEVFAVNTATTSPTSTATLPTSGTTSPTTTASKLPSNPPQISSTTSGASIGAIVGGVIGGIVFLVATLGALWCWFCLRGQSSDRASQRIPELGPAIPWEMGANGTAGQCVTESQNPTTSIVYHELQA